MDKLTIRDFWRNKVKDGTTRWTGDSMLAYELAYLPPLVPPGSRILDLGSGFGELSKGITPADGSLVAVDAEPGMAAGFEGDDRFEFVPADVVSYRPEGEFDIILLFGVVTHLTVEEEEMVYDTIRDLLAPGGFALVKHQCSDSAGFEVDTQSEALGTRYVGRYPAIAEERARLGARFSSVEVRPYPEELKLHSNSTHVAFLCRGPLAAVAE
ncbi:MAG TPA: class I SAM-dependent methyltransferase [Microbacteriaceae bacterium]|nr:class I SAM-dependent methyltransferase [Microbacteriaceae bacterium]